MRYRASARRWRYPPSAAIVAAPAPVQPTYFNAPIPSPWNPAYDRAMVLLLRSPAVTGIYIADPGYPPTPPVAGIKPYEYAAAGGAVFQYDDLVGKYVQLSQYDAQRNFALPPPLPYPAGP